VRADYPDRVTRIIAGFAGSLTLRVPSAGTRPTSDRVREALFSSLEARHAIADAQVLDLYAGSGALGLEAASRGAATVTLVEKSHAAVRVCKANAALVVARAPASDPLAVTPPITVISKPVYSFLTSTIGHWNLVFIDPPYELDELELGQVLAALVPHLISDAVIALERSSRTPVPAWPAGLTLDKVSRYGETVIYWLSPREAL
jgi:16S rRNA (guanine966-N2)-methyltransferase